jgi:hypothetical protein
MSDKVKTDFLVSDPSFVSGMGRLLDWYGQFDRYNYSRNEKEADTKAMYADWRMVGDEIFDAMLANNGLQTVE